MATNPNSAFKKAVAVSKNYTDKTVVGGGAIKGKNCTVTSITPIAGGNRVTFQWTLDDGTVQTDTLDVFNGEKGDTGDKGDRGAIGPAGAQGIQGVQGPTGPKGDTGATGAAGPQGIQGIQGIQGPKGDDGYPFLIYKQYDTISEFDETDFPEIGLLFMVMVEDYDPQDPTQSIGYPIYRYTGAGTPPYSLVVHLASQGIKGEKGDKGDTGAQGVQGEKGDKGDKGEKGEKGDTGAQGIQGEQGVGMPEGGSTEQILAKNSNEDYDFYWKTLGTAALKNSTDSVRPNSHDLVESVAVYSAINNALSSVYTARGDISVAELTSSLLVAANVGNVYELSDSGITTALFLQGAGVPLVAGDNVGIIQAGPNTYLFNKMAGAFDLTKYQEKDLAQAVEGETTVEDALGALSTNKADKVASATAGDIATLDANGNLVDSGVVASSVIRRVNPSTAVDCNDLIDRFTEYRVGDGDANRPTTDSNAYIISTFKTGAASTTYSQIAYQIGGTNIYRRNFSSTTWSPWEKLVTPSDLTDYQKKDLTTPITVGGTSQTTVESTLGALANLLIPVGTISAYGGSSAPSGYLLCNGSEVSKTTYASLYAVIGDKFGTASVNTKFRLPDLREATTKGVGLTSKSSNHYDADGLALGEFIDDRIKAHSHRIMTYAGGQTSISNVYGNTGIASNIDASDSLAYVTNVTRSGSKGPIIESTGSATTEVKAVGVNYIIKY